jgi:hypothetical protein
MVVVPVWCHHDAMSKLQRRPVFLTAPQLQCLQREAEKLGITVSDLVRRIVDQWRAGRA